MIAGIKRQDLTLGTILDRTTEYDIYKYYLRHDFELGEPFSSPFHDDREPSFSIIRTSNGRLHFTDFGGDASSGKVIDFVRKFYPGSNYNDILKAIDRDMGLGICNRSIVSPSMLNGQSGGQALPLKERKLIQVITRKFNQEELAYWNRYHLDLEDLKKEPAVYALRQLYVDKKLVTIPKTELAFGYLYEDKYWKIYKPLARTRKEKWISNVPHTIMYGMGDLQRGKPVLSVKAHKDCKICRKVFGNTCGFQHEAPGVISPENVRFLTGNFKRVYLNCDPDQAGISTLDHYVSNHGFSPFTIPEMYRGPLIKDLADLAMHRGLEFLQAFINQKIPF